MALGNGEMRVGIDYGGTKIAGIGLNAQGQPVAEARVPTPRHDYDRGLHAIVELVDQLEAQAGSSVAQVGVGVPGSVDRSTGRVSLGNSVWLHNRDLREDLAAHLGCPVKIANDANCFALSEAVDGAGKGAQVVFGAILGTGVGGGVVVGGKLIEGINAVGGEWGHIPLPSPTKDEQPGPMCSCGVPGHIEAWLSGPSLAADHARKTGGDGALGAPQIVALADQGDPSALATLERFEDRLGRALAVIVNLIDPDVIVLGGGLSNVTRFYETVPAKIEPHVFGDRFRTKFVQNVHGDASGVRGAAWL
ncbi:MAG: ROK family protein [Pseudomonadota bacterium]